MTQELAQTVPLGAAIRALEQAKSSEEVLAATLRLQSVLETLDQNPPDSVRAMTRAAGKAVEAAMAYERLRAARSAGQHKAAASAAAAYRHSIEV